MKGKFLKWIYIGHVYAQDDVLVIQLLSDVVDWEAKAKVVYSSVSDIPVNDVFAASDLNDDEVWEDITPFVGGEYISIMDSVHGRFDEIRRIVSFDPWACYEKLSIEFANGDTISPTEFFKKYIPVDEECGQGYTEGYLAGRTGLRWL